MNAQTKVTADHLRKQAILYVRQSTLHQVKENRESTALQYDLKRHARELGWNVEQTVVIDEDLGESAVTATDRSGFQRLVAEVTLGRVGLVMGLNASRLARNNADWHRLLEICALTGTLIVDEDGIYDPNHFNDRLLLGLKGTMSEAELYMLRARLIGGLLNKARRGDLWLRPPIGFIYDENQRFVFDPDEQIQGAVRLLFETFRRTGSAGQVVRHFSNHSILWPSRAGRGNRVVEVVFGKLRRSMVQNVLHNPRYAGAFVYGRTRKRKGPDGRKQSRWLAREEWQVFLPDAHPGYISWEEYESNLAKLRENAHINGRDLLKGPVREGSALLQGLALCGRCGLRMSVRYHFRKGGKLVPNYVCQRLCSETGQPSCQYIAGAGVDEAVGQAVVEAVTPSALDVALQLFEELRARKADVDRLRRAQVERVREEAELAERQYMLARPENRLVVDTLERQWNESLARLARAETEYSRATKADGFLELSAEYKARVAALASDFPRVWKDPRTSARDRKRMLRLLIEDVTLARDGELIRVHIRWKGGATTSLEVSRSRPYFELIRTPAATIETIRALAAEQTDGQIAHILNSRLYRSGAGKSFTGLMVRQLRLSYGIESYGQQLRRIGWLTPPEIASSIGVHPETARTYAKKGLLHAVRINDKGDLLFEPPSAPIPCAHRGKRYRDRPARTDVNPQMRNEVQYET
jgi:DNA invertase Pin-like site-specific DNA recombinase